MGLPSDQICLSLDHLWGFQIVLHRPVHLFHNASINPSPQDVNL